MQSNNQINLNEFGLIQGLSVNDFGSKHAKNTKHGKATIAYLDILIGTSITGVRFISTRRTQKVPPVSNRLLEYTYQQSQLLGRLVIECYAKVTSSKVTRRFSRSFFDKKLVKADDDNHLDPTKKRNNIKRSKTIRNIIKFQIGRRAKVSHKSIILLHQHTKGCSHRNAPMLHLELSITTKVVEWASVGTILYQTKGTENSKTGGTVRRNVSWGEKVNDL